MAGIGFELKKVFKKKGLLATLAAYGYAGIVCTGPMLLGIVLLLGIRLLGELSGTGRSDIDLVNAMVTYALLASLLLTDVFSLVTTRYIADMLYMEKKDRVLPSFWGSVSVQLVIGWALYGTFLCFAGITPGQVFMNIVFFSVMVVVWMEMNYLTAIKDYRGILVTFALAVGLALLVIVMVHVLGVARKGGHYIGHFFKPTPIFVIINAIEEIAKPITLSFRLFGNILAGEILIIILLKLMPIWMPVPSVIWLAFSIFIGAVQAFIFTMLSMAYFANAVKEDEE